MQQTTRREEIAENIRALKGRRRVTDADIAEVLGISRPAVTERLNGRTNFRIEELERLADFFEVQLLVLLAPAGAADAS